MIRDSYVVLDTNQWFRIPMLRAGLAALLLHRLYGSESLLGIPYVVRREVEKDLIERNRDANAHMQNYSTTLRRLFGEFPSFVPKNDDAVRKSFRSRLNELSDLIIQWDENTNDYTNAARMVLDVVPPNASKNQQFKDSVIWSAIAHASRERHVYFITEDKGFNASKNSSKIHPELLQLLPEDSKGITILKNIEGFLDISAKDESGNLLEDFTEYVVDLFRAAAEKILPDHTSLRIVASSEDYYGVQLKVYLTENHNVLFFSGTASFSLFNGDFSAPENMPSLTVKATATVNVNDLTTKDNVEVEELFFETFTENGDAIKEMVLETANVSRRADYWSLRLPL